MWNVLLDPLPEKWKGYPIDSDFQTGIQISQCLADDELTEYEQFQTAVELLFPYEGKRPAPEEAAKALKWFLSEYYHDNNTGDESSVRIMDFDIDQWRIYAAFLAQYQIDLNTANMHWFTFMGLLTNLNECSLTNVMNIRQKKITPKMSDEEKAHYKKLKQTFEIKSSKREEMTTQDQQAVEEFLEFLNMNK